MRNSELDIVGKRFYRLTAIGKTDVKLPSGRYGWCFRCDCGRLVVRYKASVVHGLTKSCGCMQDDRKAALSSTRTIDMRGVRFGTLNVVDRAPDGDRSRGVRWLCRCDCRHEFEVLGRYLRNGQVRYCPKCRQGKHPEAVEEGDRFGDLIVVRQVTTGAAGRVYLCECDCGRTTKVPAKYLRSGNTKSCGCRRFRKGVTGQSSVPFPKGWDSRNAGGR